MERAGGSFQKRFPSTMRAKSSDAFYLLCVEGGALWYGHNTAVVMLRFPHKQSKELTQDEKSELQYICDPVL